MNRFAASAILLLAASVAVGQYDHLTITVDSLAPQLAPLCDHVENTLGLNDTVVLVDDVLLTSPGRDDQEKLRNYIRDAYSNWGLTHVLLAGDDDQLPCRLCWVYINNEYRDWIPTELYYSALDGDWDGDGDGNYGEPEDSVDLVPDVLLGRLPLATPGEMAAFVQRYLVYTGDSTRQYLQDVLFAGFDYSPTFHGEEACELYDSLLRPETMRSVKVYDSHSGNHEDSVKHTLDRGMHVWVQLDHCNYNVLGSGYINHGWLLWTTELDDMANAPDYTINLTAGCLPSAFDSSYCVAEVLLTAPQGGCVATLGNSRIGFGTSPDPIRGGSHFYLEKCLERFWQGPGSGTFSGLQNGQVEAAPLAASDAVWRWCHYEYLLAGAPAMRVWVPGASWVEERSGPGRAMDETRMPTVMTGPALARTGFRVVDIQGRDVTGRRQTLSPGVYFVTDGSGVRGSRCSAMRKVIVGR